MKEDLKQEVFDRLETLLSEHVPPLKAGTDTQTTFEVKGTKEAMQGKKKVDGMYFASAVNQKNHVGFYFFPIYTNPERFDDIPDDLKKTLKGKSCFHIKKNDEQLFHHINEILDKGVQVYKEEGLI